MNITDIFNLGNKKLTEGNQQMAMQMWQECISMDPLFGPAYINLANAFKQMNQPKMALDHLRKFLNCPVNGHTIELIPKVRQEIADIEASFNPPQPTPEKK